ncbi:relaxase/mobilization nuclease domain-containing protein [Nostoc sp. FACHB-892]|uniref:relaxase/mobilization nuclease domain-containing protein n=1 Tax=Nostoc sp. FACHB-892 TaxID=2692843 RepID=UPI001F54F1DF|nr:relaxase/mobilization nuclease domain-containing protein [Nostoc sp. FACHB-892]
MTIEELKIDNFDLIKTLSQQYILANGSFIDINIPPTQIIDNFNTLSGTRPRLKSLGIYIIISLKNIYIKLNQQLCIQIVNQYIHGIGWHDLQYICFFDINPSNVYIHIVFNRVTPEGKLIDIKYLGANWQQYEVLRQSCSRILENPANNKYLQIRCNCCS